jgi:ABC-type nitrate/sulfonate/bicarbonate transport system permease component
MRHALASGPFTGETALTIRPMALNARPLARLGPWRWYVENERVVLGVGSFVAFLALWELGSDSGFLPILFVSSPSGIVTEAVSEFQTLTFWNDLRLSVIELVIGFSIGSVAGILVGLLAGWYRRFNYFIDPWLSFFYSLPRVALLPLIVLWLGLTTKSVILAVFMGAFFTVTINTLSGVRTVDKRFLEVATSFRASQRRVFLSVVLPSTVPFILAGLRLGVGHALVGVFLGELYAANQAGLGYLILVAGEQFEPAQLLFGVLIFTMMGLVFIEGLRMVEARFQRWRPRAAA